MAIIGGLGREGVKILPLRISDVELPPALADTFWLALDPSSVSDAAGRIKRTPKHTLRTRGASRVLRGPKTVSRVWFQGECRLGLKLNLRSSDRPSSSASSSMGGQPRNDGTSGSAL